MELHRLINRIQAWIIAHPKVVLALGGVLVAGSLLLGFQVEYRTSRSELAPPGDPEQERFDRLIANFRGTEALVACVEVSPGAAEDPEAMARFADALAGELAGQESVGRVFHRVDVGWFLERGLYLVDPSILREVAAVLDADPSLVDDLASAARMADLNDALAARLERGVRTAVRAGEAAETGARIVAALVAAERRFLEDPGVVPPPGRTETALADAARAAGLPLPDGYLRTRDGKTLFVFVSPEAEIDTLADKRAFVARVRSTADQMIVERPGFRVALTGNPAKVVEEMDSVGRDTRISGLVALAGVTLLTMLVFRWRSHAILVLLALAAGIAMALGAVELQLGYLNVITSAFVSTLIGVGVAYGIHPVSEYELQGAHTSDPIASVLAAYHRTGSAVTVAGVTTAAAFYSILLMRFRGFAELGLVAGTGVLLCLLSCLVFLPALLVVYGRWRGRRDRAERRSSAASAVDRFWVERGAARVCAFPKTVTAMGAVVTVAAAWAATGIGFDTNILELLPQDAESARYERRMILDSDLSPVFNLVTASDLDGLRRMRERALLEPTVKAFDSALRFLPEDPEVSRAALASLRPAVDEARLPDAAASFDRERLRLSFERLESALAEAADDAFAAGLAGPAAAMEEALADAENSRALVEGADGNRLAEWEAAWSRLLGIARNALGNLRKAVRAAPPTLGDLPPEIRDRFILPDGRLIAYIQPSGDVFVPEFLAEYVGSSRRISEGSTGFPIVFHHMSGRITSGFRRAVLVGAILVVLLLVIDLRNPVHALLALLPLAVGVVWMLGLMRLFELSFNFANLVAVPLIIGVGIDNGVHVIHRFRYEGREGMSVVLRHTGRAILIASLTTMIGFGSLATASHRGLSSLGLLLLLGVGSCLVTSMVVLPNVLVALGLVKR